MEDKTYFLNMFSDYEPPESLKDAISQAAIVAADLDLMTRKVTMELTCPQYISLKTLDLVSADVCDLYDLRGLQIHARYPQSELQNMLSEDIQELFIRESSITRGSLAGATWSWEDTTLTISLVANGKKELEKCIPAVQAHPAATAI